MYKKIIIILILVIILSLTTTKTVNTTNNNIIKEIIPKIILNTKEENKEESNKESPIGKIHISKINVDKPLYKVESNLNNVEKNVTILKDSSSLFVLAAHSGTGYNAYFKDLNKLNINDTINLTYKNNNYTYQVINIFEQEKTGYININEQEYDQLFLTTCSYNENKQLIIECKKINSN